MPKFDVTKLNVAIDCVLKVTENPRHRFMLQAYSRHHYLEVAGRYEEIFAPDLMSMHPVYVFRAGGNNATLAGQDNVKSYIAAGQKPIRAYLSLSMRKSQWPITLSLPWP